LDWLDSVDHLLKKDGDGSRTKAYSGISIALYPSFEEAEKISQADKKCWS
jgi:hypothetical protein